MPGNSTYKAALGSLVQLIIVYDVTALFSFMNYIYDVIYNWQIDYQYDIPTRWKTMKIPVFQLKL